MTHAELVVRAGRWLRNVRKCGVVLKEWPSASLEIPDAIGWRVGGFSTLIECKVSVSDFCADQRKSFRQAGQSAGRWRYYMTPSGLLTKNGVEKCKKWMAERCPKWGLLEVRGRFIDVVIEAEDNGYDAGAKHEVEFMYSAIRRLTCGFIPGQLAAPDRYAEEIAEMEPS